MPEELKTLKDLTINGRTDINARVDYNELKAEAVKWVKNCCCRIRGERCGGCVRLIKFCNITEEDLE